MTTEHSSQSVCGGKRLHGEFAHGTAEHPLVTIVTAVFNGAEYLERCMTSVVSQNYPNLEYIVLDGGSTDGTLQLLQKYESHLCLWVSKPDRGVYDAWNAGVSLARGEWIAFLGADDVYLPGAIHTYIALAQAYPEAEFLSSKAKLEHPTGYSPVFGGPWAWPRFTKAMSTIHVGTFHHRSLFDRLGPFNIQFRIAGDYEFMLRAGHTLKTAFTPEVTVMMRAGGVSDSTAGLYEARNAKIQAGVRTSLVAEIELRRAIIRFHVRRTYLTLRCWFMQSGKRPRRLFNL